jgi:hypothetical protein
MSAQDPATSRVPDMARVTRKENLWIEGHYPPDEVLMHCICLDAN